MHCAATEWLLVKGILTALQARAKTSEPPYCKRNAQASLSSGRPPHSREPFPSNRRAGRREDLAPVLACGPPASQRRQFLIPVGLAALAALASFPHGVTWCPVRAGVRGCPRPLPTGLPASLPCPG